MSVRNGYETTGFVATAFAIAAAIGAVVFVWPIFTGGGADMANHYALVYWIYHHWTFPPDDNVALASMARYPPGAHAVAAIVGHVVGSPFRGMQLVAIAAVAAIWTAIAMLLRLLPTARAFIAFAFVGLVLVLDVAHGPLRYQVHGYEIVANFFFAQAVGQALVWSLVWFAGREYIAGRRWNRTAIAIGFVAVLATWVHVLASVELLVLQLCVCSAEALAQWRRGVRAPGAYAAVVGIVPLTALLVVVTPGWRAMESISANNGSLDVPYLAGLGSYLAVAAIVIAASGATLGVSLRTAADMRTAIVLRLLGFTGLAIALPCFLQAGALASGSGSAYAVKKYIFGLFTTLLVDAAVLVAIALTRTTRTTALHASWRAALAIGLVTLGVASPLSHRGGDYSVAAVSQLEHSVVQVTNARRLDSGKAYAIGLPPHEDPVLDYMFSIAVLQTPLIPAADGILGGDLPQLQSISSSYVTSAASIAAPACIHSTDTELVVVASRCGTAVAMRCLPVNVLSTADYAVDPRLTGFSRPDPGGRWTAGTEASFSCLLPRRLHKPLTIAMDATAFLAPRVSRQRVTMSVAGRSTTYAYTLAAPEAAVTLRVPRPATQRLTIRLAFPDAVSPASVGYNGDTRVLALNVHSIRIH
jgi:hypothetical protein